MSARDWLNNFFGFDKEQGNGGLKYDDKSFNRYSNDHSKQDDFSFRMDWAGDPFFSMMEDFMHDFSQDNGFVKLFPDSSINDNYRAPQRSLRDQVLKAPEAEPFIEKRNPEKSNEFKPSYPKDGQTYNDIDTLFQNFFGRSFFAPYMESALSKQDTDKRLSRQKRRKRNIPSILGKSQFLNVVSNKSISHDYLAEMKMSRQNQEDRLFNNDHFNNATDLDADLQDKGLDSILNDDNDQRSMQATPFSSRSFHTSESRTMIRKPDGSSEQRITKRLPDGTEETTIIMENPSSREKRTEIRRSDGSVEVVEGDSSSDSLHSSLIVPSLPDSFHSDFDKLHSRMDSFFKFFFGK